MRTTSLTFIAPLPRRVRSEPPLDQLHRDEDAAVGLVDLVDAGDVRVRDGARGAGLAKEPGTPVAILLERRGQDLEGDDPLQLLVLGAVDDAHPAAADAPQDAEVGEAHGIGPVRPLVRHGCLVEQKTGGRWTAS
jgi:hypothetical protein